MKERPQKKIRRKQKRDRKGASIRPHTGSVQAHGEGFGRATPLPIGLWVGAGIGRLRKVEGSDLYTTYRPKAWWDIYLYIYIYTYSVLMVVPCSVLMVVRHKF